MFVGETTPSSSTFLIANSNGIFEKLFRKLIRTIYLKRSIHRNHELSLYTFAMLHTMRRIFVGMILGVVYVSDFHRIFVMWVIFMFLNRKLRVSLDAVYLRENAG